MKTSRITDIFQSFLPSGMGLMGFCAVVGIEVDDGRGRLFDCPNITKSQNDGDIKKSNRHQITRISLDITK
jgi:hypothetical protein